MGYSPKQWKCSEVRCSPIFIIISMGVRSEGLEVILSYMGLFCLNMNRNRPMWTHLISKSMTFMRLRMPEILYPDFRIVTVLKRWAAVFSQSCPPGKTVQCRVYQTLCGQFFRKLCYSTLFQDPDTNTLVPRSYQGPGTGIRVPRFLVPK